MTHCLSSGVYVQKVLARNSYIANPCLIESDFHVQANPVCSLEGQIVVWIRDGSRVRGVPALVRSTHWRAAFEPSLGERA